MEELTEVITAADFHPLESHLIMYSSSRGSIKLADLRAAALCDAHAKVFDEPEDPTTKSFFSEIIASISDVKFDPSGRYIVSRDYLTLKIWDIHMESKPVRTINIHEQLRPKLCDLYHNDCIFDKFECSLSSDGSRVVTGAYHNMFHVFDIHGRTTVGEEDRVQRPSRVCLEASAVVKEYHPPLSRLMSNQPPQPSGYSSCLGTVTGGRRHSSPYHTLPGLTPQVSSHQTRGSSSSSSSNNGGNGSLENHKPMNVESINFSNKVLHTACHPITEEVAVVSGHSLFIYAPAWSSSIMQEEEEEDSPFTWWPLKESISLDLF